MRNISTLSFALGFGAMVAMPSLAQDVVVTLDQANALARQAFLKNDNVTANKLSYGVLQQRPDDPNALVIAAATYPALGQPKRGREAAKRAFRLTKDPVLKYEAAYFAASAATIEKRYTASKIWLRRAYQLAPDDASKARVGQLFKGVARRSPLTVHLDFNISPSSNINNGSSRTSSGDNPFGGSEGTLSADAQALSGLQYRAAASFQYKLNESQTKRTTLNFGADARYYTLSSSSKADLAADPNSSDVRASDYNYESVYAGINHLTVLNKKTTLSYGFNLGQSWYGGSSLSRSIGASLRGTYSINPTRLIRYGISAQRQFRLDSKLKSSNSVTLNTGLIQQFKGAGQLRVGAFVRDTTSDSTQIDNTAVGLNLSYRFEKPVFAKTQMEMSLALQTSRYEPSFLDSNGRKDDRVTASSTLIFSDVNYYGFSPTATITASRTNSTVTRYQTESLGINVGLRSSF